MKIHPFAAEFPLLGFAELSRLATSIETNGQIDPVTIWKGHELIVDGRNRMTACEMLGRVPIYEQREFADEAEVAAFIIGKNLERRHLDESQRALLGAKLEAIFSQEAKKRQTVGLRQGSSVRANLPEREEHPRARDEAAQAVNVSPRSIQNAKTVLRDGAPELINEVQQGNLSISAAATISKMPQEEQQELLSQGADAVRDKARELRQPQASLLISTPEQRTGPGLFDQAVEQRSQPVASSSEAQTQETPQEEASSITYVDYGSGETVPPKSEIAISVEDSLAKTGELDPRTLLPLTKSVGVESSTPTKKPKLVKIICTSCHGNKGGNTCFLCTDGIMTAELVREESNGNGSYQDYTTPKWLLDLVRKINEIALDPFFNHLAITNAKIKFTKEEDGLRADRDWAAIAKAANGLVYCNPPYDDPMKPAERAVSEAKKGAEVILCLNTSHSTKWYKLLRKSCQAYAQLGRKVDFGKEGVFKDVAYQETTIFYLGPQWLKFWKVFEEDGHEVLHGGTNYVAPPDERQQALPRLEVTPQSEAPNVPDVRTEETPPKKLHTVLKTLGAEYQKQGYEVYISTPGSQKTKSVLGAIAGLKNVLVSQLPDERDEDADKWTVKFSELEEGKKGRDICALHAFKEASKEEEARSPRASRAYAQLKACLTWEEFDTVYTKLEALATELGDRNDLIEFREELRGALPSQHNVKPENLTPKVIVEAPKACPKCHCELSVAPAMRKAKVGNKWVSCPTCVPVSTPKAPAPKRLAGKSEEPIKSPLKSKNNPGAHLAKNTRKK